MSEHEALDLPEEPDPDESEEHPEFTWEIPSLSSTVIEGYELNDRIAEGAMGAVFRGKQLSLDRTVAVKILKPQLAQDGSFLKRFQREAKAVASLNHRNIVGAIDVGESRGWHYLVMEFIEGPTLRENLEEIGALPEKDALRIAWQICTALRHAHKHGLVHRDVKPDNVILSPSGDAKLCDLGLAKNVDSESTMLTAMGTAMGTPHYISPEQAAGQIDVDIRSDIYSLGATFYHMVCGQPPFDGTSAAVVMAMHLTHDVTPVQMRKSEVSEGTAAIIEKMLEKDPDDRQQTPEEVMREMKAVASGQWAAQKKEKEEKAAEEERKKPTRIEFKPTTAMRGRSKGRAGRARRGRRRRR